MMPETISPGSGKNLFKTHGSLITIKITININSHSALLFLCVDVLYISLICQHKVAVLVNL